MSEQLSLFEICLRKKEGWLGADKVEVGDILINFFLHPRATDWNEVVTKIKYLSSEVVFTLESGEEITKWWHSSVHVLVPLNREVATFRGGGS